MSLCGKRSCCCVAASFVLGVAKASPRHAALLTCSPLRSAESQKRIKICVYDKPPQNELSLHEFEQFALDRMRVLKAIDAAKAKAKADVKETIGKLCAQFLPLRDSVLMELEEDLPGIDFPLYPAWRTRVARSSAAGSSARGLLQPPFQHWTRGAGPAHATGLKQCEARCLCFYRRGRVQGFSHEEERDHAGLWQHQHE